jgi:hypothetical protein
MSGLCEFLLLFFCHSFNRWGRAENGCFIKPRPTRQGESQWINMVANFNMTWKSLCLEILHYVRFFIFWSSLAPLIACKVHGTNTWVVHRGTGGVDRVAVLDGTD